MIRFRFRLRTLFAVITTFAIVLVIVTLFVKEQQRRRRVIDHISGHGGMLFTLDGKTTLDRSDYLKLKYYVRLNDVCGIVVAKGPFESLGLGEFSDLFYLNDLEVSIPPGYLQTLPCKKSLVTLQLGIGTLLREDVQSLREFERLESLSLDDTIIDDEGMQALAELKLLRDLDLPNAPITDESVKYFVRMENLKELSISKDALSQAGQAEFAGSGLISS